jgi:hypothetical protein
MKARIKGQKEWKDYKEVFGPNNEFVGLETLGYTISEEEYCKELGIHYDPDCPFNNNAGVYKSAVLPLECFDLWDDDDFRKKASIAAMQGILAHCDKEFSYLAAESYRGDEEHTIPNGVAQFAVACADALIKELRRKEI